MKKMIAFILVVLLMLVTPAMALADMDGLTEPQGFFSWAILLTYAGAVAATTAVTQLLKGIGFIDKIPTRVFSYVIALIMLLGATYFTGGLTLESAALCLINAVVVALASNGAFDGIKQVTTTVAAKSGRQ